MLNKRTMQDYIRERRECNMKNNTIICFYNEEEEIYFKDVSELYIAESYADVTHIKFDPEEGFYPCVTQVPFNKYPNYKWIY